MKTHLVIAFIAIALLLVSGVVAEAQPGGKAPPVSYQVELGTVSGGRYHLASLAWRVDGLVSGRGYRLVNLTAPALSGNGCCCTFLPCLLNNAH
jgi:hypothetical protein